MIERMTGDLLSAGTKALVNTVNTVGVMGKGIALQFKKAFPDNYRAYKKVCDEGLLEPGKLFVFERNSIDLPKFIINFPTKKHWRGSSKLEYIKLGLAALVEEVKKRQITSVALPPLGCGHGGLNWTDVLPLIEESAMQIPGVQLLIFEPAGAPAAAVMRNKTTRPRMTPGRAAILGLMSRYSVPGYDYPLSLLEVQKLAYFLQEAGEPLRLEFAKGPYGPYADTLRHVLCRMEGHFTLGFGDGKNKPETPISLLPEAASEAAAYLKVKPDVTERFDRVGALIEGFETPLGMELLASVHWVAKYENAAAQNDAEVAASEVFRWSDRKKCLMTVPHIRAAWERLHEQHIFS